ncbi:MAG: SDR family NAD(P)-dependent oxidoreductase [Rhizomicrobium sp.]
MRITDMPDLSLKTALITGASSGLGRHFARTLARHGARVALAARRMDALSALAEEIVQAGGSALAVSLDVTDEEAVQTAVATIERDFGGIDILVNNSGVSLPKPALEQTSADWDKVIDTNLKGAFLVAREVGRAMVSAGRSGSIVNIASIVGFRPVSQLAVYGASKAGLIQLTHALALELARHDIRVNALAPGYIETEMNEGFWDTEAGRAMIRRIPQRRLGRPADLDGPLLLLASDASAYMTGVVIAVDGGHLVSPL